MTAKQFWDLHPSLQDNVFRFAEEYADWMCEQREELWMERAENWVRERQKLEHALERK